MTQHAAEWLGLLEPRQVRALASQYKVENAMTAKVETLRAALLLIPDVRELANGQKKENVQTK